MFDSRIAVWSYLHCYYAYKRWYEDSLLRLLRGYPKLLSGGDAIDVGANVGYCSWVLAQCMPPRAKVFAFEPEERNCRLFNRALAKELHEQRIELFPYALGQTDGRAHLLINEMHPGDHRIVGEAVHSVTPSTVEVPLRSLDSLWRGSFGRRPLSFIKIDVQGYELPVCRGMEEVLAAHPDISIYFEINVAPESRLELDELFSFYTERGFYCYQLVGDRLRSFAKEDEHRGRSYSDVLASRRRLS